MIHNALTRSDDLNSWILMSDICPPLAPCPTRPLCLVGLASHFNSTLCIFPQWPKVVAVTRSRIPPLFMRGSTRPLSERDSHFRRSHMLCSLYYSRYWIFTLFCQACVSVHICKPIMTCPKMSHYLVIELATVQCLSYNMKITRKFRLIKEVWPSFCVTLHSRVLAPFCPIRPPRCRSVRLSPERNSAPSL